MGIEDESFEALMGSVSTEIRMKKVDKIKNILKIIVINETMVNSPIIRHSRFWKLAI